MAPSFSPPLPVAAHSAWRYRLLAAGLFLVLILVYYWPSLHWLPRGIHEWAQGDRLALAFGFYDQGMNLFKPHTYSLMSADGVAGVEFPLIPYLAALGAKILGRPLLVPLYRLLTALTAWLAYYYLFRLVFERTGQFMAALVPGAFLAASPVFAYYAGNFLPDAVGASLAVVGAYYLLHFPLSRRFSDLVIAIAVYTLGTLIKLSAGVYLVAGVSAVFLWAYLQPAAFTLRQRWLLLLLTGASFGLLVGYTLYNQYLNKTYNSDLFLATARPFTTLAQCKELAGRVYKSWRYEYFVPFQYPLLFASLVLCLVRLRELLRAEWLWCAQLGLAAIGSLLFLTLMGVQFIHHDYYVLAPFWPGLLLVVALAITQLARLLAPLPQLGRHVLFLALALGILLPGLHRYRARMAEPYQTFSNDYTYHWMMGGAAALTKAGIFPEATILVLGSPAPNLSLVYFDRRGLVWNPDRQNLPPSALLQQMTDVGLDYLIMPRPVFEEMSAHYADLLTTFSQFTTNSHYVVLKPPHVIQHRW
jgi:hypothetical protein